MSFKLLFSLIFLVVSSEAIEGPCAFKNVSIMGSMTHKPVATPSNCGLATVNASEFSTKPNIILHNIDEATEKNESYTFMLLEEIPQIRDTFRLRWLVSNITPLRKSLTANETSITFMKYDRPVPDPTRPLKFFLYVYKQNKTAGLGLTGLGPRDYEHFAPQKWVSQNSRFIVGIAGGVEFLVAPNRSQPQPGYPNTHGGPVVVPVPSAPTQQHYPGQHQPQPSYPQAGYPHPQPGHPQPQPGQYTPPQPAYHPTPAGQPTVINNYYGKVKDEKKDKKKNFAVTSGPLVGLVALMASAVIMKS